MPDAVMHPTPQELTAFGLGKLPERAAAVVAAHLESCAACRQAVAGVSADSFLNKVREAKQDKTLLPPSSAQRQNAPSSADRPAIPVVPCPNVPPELASHPKYLILRELGRGGMGVVYQARQTMMNRQVVIKVVNRSLLDRPDSLERFRREVQAAAQLSHRNIVTAYDAEQAGELHMLVMEFVPGQSLAEVLEKKGPQPVAHACHYMRQTALGLQHAHERGMVHRDIKPQNLMLMPNGQIKILDFGLAKVASERSANKGLTSSDACMGTPEYIAPEQAEDARAADIRADLYSLGCTLYCLLAGRPPFREDTWMKTVLAHIQKTPQPLTELCPDVPERLWRVVARLMAKEPAKRYQKPIEVVQALAPFIVKSGTKPNEKGAAAPAPAVKSPVMGTKISADTNQIKKVLQEVPGKALSKREPSKAAASPLADGAVSASLTLTRGPKRKGKKGCVLTAAVSASLALTLMLMAGIIIKIKVQTPNGDTGKVTSSKGSVDTPKPLPAEAIVVLEIDQPGAEVFVDGRNIKVNVPGDSEPIEIKVEPGLRTLRISKAGFVARTKDIELTAGRSKPLRIRLEPEPPKPGDKGDEKWIQEVARQPAESQVKAVAAKLKERNPGFDGEVKPTYENEVVTGLEIVTDQVTDLSPLRALPGLKRLSCVGTDWNKGKLVNLAPLKGMHLTGLDCQWNNRISDLSPLKEMQLTGLSCIGTSVSDLSPLRGMPLAELNCQYTRVSDLSPLKDMPLKVLLCGNSKVSDLSPLKGVPLTSFGCNGTQVSDLSPLKDMNLAALFCVGTPVSNLSPLKRMPLAELHCQNTQVTDLSPLKGLPLKKLSCPFQPERDAKILRSITSLEEINGKPVAQFWKEVDEKKRKEINPPAANKPRATLPADSSVDDLRQALKDKDPAFQEEAAKRLEKLGPKAEPALADLEDTLTNPEYPDKTRELAALAIGHIGATAKSAVPSLVKMLDSDERWEIRESAVKALIELGYPANESAHRTLLKIIEKDSNTNLRCLCVIALGSGNNVANFRKLGADRVLTKLLDEKDGATAVLRYNAAFFLAYFLQHEAPPKTAELLLEFLKHKEFTVYKVGGSTRIKAVEALARLGDKATKRPDVARALREAAKDEDEKLRKAAQEAMKELNIKEAEPKKASPKKTPPNDYDDLAKGSWVPLLTVEKFNQLRKEKAYAGSEPKLDGDVLKFNGCRLFCPCPKAKDVIVRALVKRSGPKDAGFAQILFRGANDEGVLALFTGGEFQIVKTRGEKWSRLAICNSEPYDGYFEFAFAVVGNRLILYAKGRKILDVPDEAPDHPPLGRPVVKVVVGVNGACSADFKKSQIQVLKEPK